MPRLPAALLCAGERAPHRSRPLYRRQYLSWHRRARNRRPALSIRLVKTADLGIQPYRSGRARLLSVACFEETRSPVENEQDVYSVALEADTPNVEVRKLRAKIRRDWKLGIKTGALIGRKEAPDP